MNKPKYTPAPWNTLTLHKDAGLIDRIGVGPIDYEVCRVNCYGDNGEKNARLIAAAPELFEALAKLVQSLPPDLADSPDCADAAIAASHLLAKIVGDL